MVATMPGSEYSRLMKDGPGLAETGIQSWCSHQMEFPQLEWVSAVVCYGLDPSLAWQLAEASRVIDLTAGTRG